VIKKLLRWARITKAGENGQQFQTQQLEYMGKVGDGFMVFPYGIHGNCMPDCLALLLSVGGDAENRATIAWDAKNRPDLQAGEVAFYHPPTMATMIWKANGDMDIVTGDAGAGSINITSTQINVTASDSVNITTSTTVNVLAAASVNIDTPITNLGVGGEKIARLGDSVKVTVTGGSSAGDHSGIITSAGINTSI